jgi:hypothetical protein
MRAAIRSGSLCRVLGMRLDTWRSTYVSPGRARNAYDVRSGARASRSSTWRSTGAAPANRVEYAAPQVDRSPAVAHSMSPSTTGVSVPGVWVRRDTQRPTIPVGFSPPLSTRSHSASTETRSSSTTRVGRVRHFARVDVTEAFPFLVTRLAPFVEH